MQYAFLFTSISSGVNRKEEACKDIARISAAINQDYITRLLYSMY